MNEKSNTLRSELWNEIYKIVDKLPNNNESTGEDCIDKPSITTEIEKLLNRIVIENQANKLLNAYKEGFDAATQALVSANDIVKNRKKIKLKD